jgi:hypothetical protein
VLAVRLGIPHQELDALFHGTGWVRRPTFVAEVTALAATESWVVEWQYDQVRSLLPARADLLVWLDLSRTPGVHAAPVAHPGAQGPPRRAVERQPRATAAHDPHRSRTRVRWAWGSYARIGPRVQGVLAQPDHPVVVRLRSRREIRRWLAQVG